MEKQKYILGEDSINGISINEKIIDEDLFEYRIIHRESFIDELICWISECNRPGEKQLMIDDLKDLFKMEDEYIFSSIQTNDYICSEDVNFDFTCQELLKLNETELTD